MCCITYLAILMFLLGHQIEPSDVWSRYPTNNFLMHVLEESDLEPLELLMVLEFFCRVDDSSFYPMVALLEEIDARLIALCCMAIYLRNHYSKLRY